MNNFLIDLFSHEWEALLEALRRDLRAEVAKCESDPVWADLHRINVTRNIRLLETINPKPQTLDKIVFWRQRRWRPNTAGQPDHA